MSPTRVTRGSSTGAVNVEECMAAMDQLSKKRRHQSRTMEGAKEPTPGAEAIPISHPESSDGDGTNRTALLLWNQMFGKTDYASIAGKSKFLSRQVRTVLSDDQL